MKRVHFYYSTKLTFDDYVHNHSFALRIIPPETDTQRILSCDLNITPYVSVKQTRDAFGNNVTAGYLKGDHRFLDFEIKGTAEVDTTRHRTDYMPCYLYHSLYTQPGETLSAFYHEIKQKCTGTAQDRAGFLCDRLSDKLSYEQGFTDTQTTAESALVLGKGVCQDFSHILTALLRMDGIAARYIAGLAFCDGETHSWVEYWTGDHWEGIDPANNCPVNDDYIVLSQGRDFRDCSIDRGVMFGKHTRQLQLVRSVLS
ncbi:MAG: transglutaminase family protein [Clostridia bacterium]|nr:transglutaminase family protein [Clostridia bacterium]